jgi:hypothetical protein
VYVFFAEGGCFNQTLTKRKHWYLCPTIQLQSGRIVIASQKTVIDILRARVSIVYISKMTCLQMEASSPELRPFPLVYLVGS